MYVKKNISRGIFEHQLRKEQLLHNRWEIFSTIRKSSYRYSSSIHEIRYYAVLYAVCEILYSIYKRFVIEELGINYIYKIYKYSSA